MDLTFDIASLIAIFTIAFAYNEMKNNKKAELTRQQEKEKAQIQLLIIDWVHGEPFSSTEKTIKACGELEFLIILKRLLETLLCPFKIKWAIILFMLLIFDQAISF
ncbi:MAG: hypothetical protein IJ187_00790 [Neisseriaceae bacterium]|nr:hypothetical protein [Neisseriaceae bacterium]MBQ9725165.1 hypothetical protein [Neisseriaceae bacterium]